MTIMRLAARTILTTLASLMLWAALPAAWGWLPTTVMSDSMAPRVLRGDVVVSLPTPADRLEVGRVALVDDPDHPGRLRFHRVIAIGGDEIMTKGDANPQPDSTPVDFAGLRGVGILRIPYVGYPIVWVREHDLAPLLATGVGLAALIALAFGRTATPGGHGRRRAAASAATALAAAGILAVGALAPAATPAHASFTAQSTSPAATFSSATTFSCLTPTPADNPYFSYPFTEGSGAAVHDASGNGRNGQLHGTYAHVPGSCTDSPAVTLGDQGYVSAAGAVTGPAAFSVELWFRTSTTTGGRLIGFGNTQTGASTQFDRHIYMTDAGRLVFGTYVFGYDTIQSTASYNDDSWHHVVGTVSLSGMHLYVDGVSVASNPLYVTAEADSGYWRIGYDSLAGWPSAPSSPSFEGMVSAAAVYTSALTSGQVTAHFTAGR